MLHAFFHQSFQAAVCLRVNVRAKHREKHVRRFRLCREEAVGRRAECVDHAEAAGSKLSFELRRIFLITALRRAKRQIFHRHLSVELSLLILLVGQGKDRNVVLLHESVCPFDRMRRACRR